MSERLYTRAEVERAWNDAASLIGSDPGLYLTERDYCLVNVVVNAIGSLLDNPGMSLDDVIQSNWQELDEDSNDVTVETVRGWLR